MRARVYRSLDKPSAFFGIRGRFITWLLLLAGGALVVALFVGILTTGWFGGIVFATGAVASYMYIINLQGKSSDRAMAIKLNSRKYVRYIRMPASTLRSLLMGSGE